MSRSDSGSVHLLPDDVVLPMHVDYVISQMHRILLERGVRLTVISEPGHTRWKLKLSGTPMSGIANYRLQTHSYSLLESLRVFTSSLEDTLDEAGLEPISKATMGEMRRYLGISVDEYGNQSWNQSGRIKVKKPGSNEWTRLDFDLSDMF